MHYSYLLLFLILIEGCSKPAGGVSQSAVGESVYSAVISHLSNQDVTIGRFIGTDIWVSPKFAEGDSLGLGWGTEIEVDDVLIESLRAASQEDISFPTHEMLGAKGQVKEIKSFHDLYYYGENMQDVDAKCLVQFWRPGYSSDGDTCIIRFRYGPAAHGAAGTYILRRDDGEWEIIASTISYYV